jgi:hypothetical protein
MNKHVFNNYKFKYRYRGSLVTFFWFSWLYKKESTCCGLLLWDMKIFEIGNFRCSDKDGNNLYKDLMVVYMQENRDPSHRSSRDDGSRNDEPGTGTTFLCRFYLVGSISSRRSRPGRTIPERGTRHRSRSAVIRIVTHIIYRNSMNCKCCIYPHVRCLLQCCTHQHVCITFKFLQV